MPEVFKNVTHCLFDMDGLLLDTELLYTKAFQQILDDLDSGETYTNDFKVTLMGRHIAESAQMTIDRYNLKISVEDFLKKLKQISGDLLPTDELLPGVDRLIRHLHAKKVPFALATSSIKETYDLKTSNHREFFDLFDHRVCGSDEEVVNSKPAPDIFIVAARRFPDNPPIGNCLVFEDAPNGVDAGIAAGCQVVMVPEDYITPELRVGATQVLKSLEDFKPEQFGLPPFDA